MEFHIKKSLVLLLCVVIRFGLSETENSARCYICNSFLEETCESEKLSSEHLKNCSSLKHGSKYKFCRTITQTVDANMLSMKAGTRVIRQCATDWDKKRACYNKGGLGGRSTVCHCEGDGCNSASLPTSVIVTVFLSLAFSLVLL